MSYTALRVTERGVVLFAEHRARIQTAGPAAMEAFDRFAREACPGVYSVWADNDRLRVAPRPESRLSDGMPVRLCTSPFARDVGMFPKPGSPSCYDSVRLSGVATLLLSADESEIFEACSAAVVLWDGRRFRCAPSDRPRVASTAEAALRRELPSVEAPLLVHGREPLVLVNAVKGACTVTMPGREPVPEQVVASIAALLDSTARRP